MTQHFTIIGSARGLPDHIVTASELDQRLGRTTTVRPPHEAS